MEVVLIIRLICVVEPDPEPTMSSDEAWTALVQADRDKDLDDFKVFFLEYVRNNRELTFVDLERKFREEGLGVYLIAIVFPIPTNVAKNANLVGKRYSSTKNNSQPPGQNRKKVSCLFPTWIQESSYSVYLHLTLLIIAPRKVR